MSGRFVRASKYRHVHGVAAKKEKAFLNTKVQCAGDGNHICASGKFWACALQGGGGPMMVHPHAQVGRLDHNHPRLNVHKAPVLDMEFSPFLDNLLGTVAEDGLVKLTAVPDDGDCSKIAEATVTMEGHQKKVSFLHFHPTAANVLATASFDNTLKVWDFEKKAQLFSIEDHTDYIQSFEWNDDGSLIASACKDKLVRIFDPRQKGAVNKGTGSEGSKGCRVVWMENQGKLATVGFSKTNTRQYVLYDPKKLDTPVIAADIDTGAGNIITYYDRDTCILYCVGKGDAAIKYFEVVPEEPYVHFVSDYRESESIKGACFLPKVCCDTKVCEIAIAYRVMRDWVSPVSFQVPRKSDLFQADIYPDTYAGVSALSADEWLAGANKPAPKRSMKPGSSAPAKQEFKAPSSSGSSAACSAACAPARGSGDVVALQKELEAAQARIKELEDENAKLKGN